jgi:glyoxylase-like metal-dependent hydrolase (beta-lactamase superfamily II)
MRVRHWWPIRHRIDLGGRQLEILHTPGHAPDHVALWDAASNILLAADFIYLGALYGQVKGADLAAYLLTTEQLLERIDSRTAIFGAHGRADDEGRHNAPRLERKDLEDLLTSLKMLKKSKEMPRRIEVNANMHLLTSPASFAAWHNAGQSI